MLCKNASNRTVQGVGFHFHTAHQGLMLDLTGYARNLADDAVVEVLACGEQEKYR